MLPGGDAIDTHTLAMSDITSFDDARLMVRSLRTGQQREILREGSFAAYSPTGDLAYTRAGALLTQFRSTSSDRSSLARRDRYSTWRGDMPRSPAPPSISCRRTERCCTSLGKSESPERALTTWVARDGRATRDSACAARTYQDVSISP